MRDNRRWLAARLLGELMIVFVGVTAAFVVENYRQELQDRRRAQLLAAALYRDLDQFAEAATAYVKMIQGGLGAWSAEMAAGKRPAPYVLRVAGAEAPPIGVWQAAMQSGAGEVLYPDLIIQLSTFYNEISGETVKYQRYALFTEQRVWPLLAAGDTSAFYVPRTGQLRPEFVAHRRQLEEIVSDLVSQSRAARLLADTIAARFDLREASPE